jgi:hypothetical protein
MEGLRPLSQALPPNAHWASWGEAGWGGRKKETLRKLVGTLMNPGCEQTEQNLSPT